MRTLAGWCVKHRWMVVLFWLIALFVSQGLASAEHSAYSNSFSFAKTQSSDAILLLKASAPKSSGDIEQVVYAAKSGTLPKDSLPPSLQTAMDKLEKLPHVGSVSAPTVDAKGTVGFVNVTFDEQANAVSETEAKHFVAVARTGASSTVAVNVTGQLAEFADGMSFSSTGLGVLPWP